MAYPLIKLYARGALRLYCRQLVINDRERLKSRGPLLLAANHPNSFLDGILLTTLFDNDIYALARGDAFRHHGISRFLRWLRLLPVYRTSEGVENLGHNYTTFAACQQTFEQGGIVLIFSEGRCENEWHFRPLKKGTARLAITAWEAGIPLQVVPVAFNYSSFKRFGKTVHIHFGTPITCDSIERSTLTSKQLLQFNDRLHDQLQAHIYEIAPDDKATVHRYFKRHRSPLFYGVLTLPALLGWVLHAPLFYPIKWFTRYRFRNSGHYDSVLHSLLMIAYIPYLLSMTVVLFMLAGWAGLLTLLVLPLTAWAWVQWSEVLE